VIDLQQAAKDHLWLYFARMRVYRSSDAPIRPRRGLPPRGHRRESYLGALAGAKDD
jgi:hypothetical protein